MDFRYRNSLLILGFITFVIPRERKRAAIQAARGLFSVDQERLAAAQAMKLENCEELQFWR